MRISLFRDCYYMDVLRHDYNGPESNWGVSQVVDPFLRDKPEKVIDIPDVNGSAIIHKI